jgi:hypothetical protein
VDVVAPAGALGVAPDVAPAHIVGEDEDNVRAIGGGGGGGGDARQQQQQQDDERDQVDVTHDRLR